jgi:hypothetical protein
MSSMATVPARTIRSAQEMLRPYFCEVGVVGPAVQRLEALLAAAGAPSAVSHAVGAGGVPGHADEQGAVVAEVGRPPVLGRGHELLEVLLDGREVQAGEGLGVVEVLAIGVGNWLDFGLS